LPSSSFRSSGLVQEAGTGRFRGYCFVEYNAPESASAALVMDRFLYGGREMKVARPSNFTPMAPPIPRPKGATPLATLLAALPPDQLPAYRELVRAEIAKELTGRGAAGLLTGAAHVVATSPVTPPVLPSAASSSSSSAAAAAAAATAARLGVLLPSSVPSGPGTPSPGSAASSTIGNRLYVGSVVFELSEAQLKEVFVNFGAIKSCQLIPVQDTPRIEHSRLLPPPPRSLLRSQADVMR
jgi:hypothetical protein